MSEFVLTKRGSAIETTNGNTISIPNVVTDDFDSLLVIAGGLNETGVTPTVDYGGVEIVNNDWRLAPVSTLGAGLWLKELVSNGRTSAVNVTFQNASDRRFAIAYTIKNAQKPDQLRRNVQDTDTTTPSSLITGALADFKQMAISYHMSNGPLSDTPGVFESTYGFAALDRIGTEVGSNDITIQTGFSERNSTDAIRSRMTGATSRKWLSAVLTIQESWLFKQGITTSDILDVNAIFNAHSLNFANAAWRYNIFVDEWEVYDTTILSTKVAHRTDAGLWVDLLL